MKSFKVLALLCIMLPGVNAQAQYLSDSVRFAESIWSMERKKIVLGHMQLTEGEKAGFWPVYDMYCNAIQYLEMEYIQLISEYNREVNNLDDMEIEKLSSRILQNDLLLAKVRKQFHKRFTKAISPSRTMEFLQLDTSIRTLLRTEAQTIGSPAEFSHADASVDAQTF